MKTVFLWIYISFIVTFDLVIFYKSANFSFYTKPEFDVPDNGVTLKNTCTFYNPLCTGIRELKVYEL